MESRTDDLVLLERTTVEGVIIWLLELTRNFEAELITRETPKKLLPLTDQMLGQDELWLCRSRRIGPLYGHRGVALVRDGEIIQYVNFINH